MTTPARPRSGRPRSVLALAAATVCATVLAGCAASDGLSDAGEPVGGATATPGGDGQGFVAGDGTAVVLPVDQREPAPELAGPTLDGGELDVAQLRPDVVVLNVWGSWCAPCRAEAPTLQEAYQDTRDDGVSFVGLNIRDQDAAAQAFERRFGITYPSIVDPAGTLLLGFRDTLPPTAIPSTLLIDREGRVAARVLGVVTYTQLTRLIGELAAEPG